MTVVKAPDRDDVRTRPLRSKNNRKAGNTN
jgi:hypothetical protein